MADTVDRLGLEVDASSLVAGTQALDNLSAAAARFASSLDPVARSGANMGQVLADLGRSLSTSGPLAEQNARTMAELAQRYGVAGQAGQQAAAGVQQAGQAAQAAAPTTQALAAANQNLGTAAQQAQQATAGLAPAMQQAGAAAQQATAGTQGLAGSLANLIGAGGGGGGLGSFGGGFLGAIAGGVIITGLEEAGRAVADLTKEVIDDGEAWVMAGQRIQATMGLEQTQARQFRDQLAQASQGVDLDKTFTLAARIGPSLQEMGRSGTETVGIIRSLNELMAVSGTDANHANRAFFELSRAFAEGTLNGRELRALVGDMPALFHAIAEGAGVSTGELMAMGHTGQISGQLLAEALVNVAPKIQEEFQGMGTTVSRALTDVSNAFEQTVGQAAEDTGAIQALGGAIETFAALLRSDAVQGTFHAFAQFLADVGKGVTESARQIEAAKGIVAGAVGATPQPTTPRGFYDQAAERQRDAGANAEAADQLNRQFKGYQLATDPGLSDAYRRQAQQLGNQGDLLFLEHGGRGGGQVAGEGTAEQLGATSVPSSYPAIAGDLQKIDTAGKSVADIQEKIAQQQQAINDLVKPQAAAYDDQNKFLEAQAAYQQKISALQTEHVTLERELGTAQKGQDIQKIVDQQHVSLEEATKRYALMSQENQGLDTIASTQAKIKQLEADRAVFPEKAAQINGLIAQQQQHLHELEDRRAKTAQSHADAIARQREALLAQESPEAALLAAEEKIARARKEGVLTSQADVSQASMGAYEKYAAAVEAHAAKQAAGQTQTARVQAEINALEAAGQQHGEARVALDAEVLRLRGELAAIYGKEQDALDKQNATIDAGIAKQRTQLAQLQARGGGSTGLAIQEARQAAVDSVPQITPAQMDAPGGGAAFDTRARQQQQKADLAEQIILQQQYNTVLRQVQTPLQAYDDELSKLNDLYGRGKLSAAEYARAVVGIVTPEQQHVETMARIAAQVVEINRLYLQGNITLQQRTQLLNAEAAAAGNAAAKARQAQIEELYAQGEPGSGVPAGQQMLAGLQAGGLELLEQYGNISKQIGTGLKDAFGQATDALTSFLTTGKADFRGMVTSIFQDLTKLALQYAIVAAARAAAGLFGGGGGGGAAAAAGPTALFPGLFHQGGMVGEAGPSRLVSPMLFAGAPRALGGIDLSAGEVPIIAHRGERVLNPAETAAYNSRGGSGGTSVSMTINVDARGGSDPGALEAAARRGAQMGAAQALSTLDRNPAARSRIATGR
jgi:lambda family phage tail tape measure protein